MRRHVESGLLPRLVALVHHRGREHVEAIGTEAFGSNVPIRRDTMFRLASMTKPITAVGTMVLVEECRVRLDDPVDEWLPELKDRRFLRTIESPLDDTVPAKRRITLRDLLTFRSGYGGTGLPCADMPSPEGDVRGTPHPGRVAVWGLTLGEFIARSELAGVPGRFGWDGAFGTSWSVDPKEQMVGVFMTQRRPEVLNIPTFILDFWTSPCQLFDD